MLLGETLHIVAGPEDEGMRLDKFLSVRVPRSAWPSRARFPVEGKLWKKNTACAQGMQSK